MTQIEWVAAALGIANITLLVRRSVWNYPFALAMVSLYAVIFWQQKLYSDAGLQIFFFVINIYGWWHWSSVKRSSANGQDELPVRWLAQPARLWMAIGIMAMCALWGTLMARLTDAAAPYWDGSVAMISIAAQGLLARRYIENWLLWIVVDLLAIGLYFSRGLHVTSGLYFIFLIFAVLGYWQWVRAQRAMA